MFSMLALAELTAMHDILDSTAWHLLWDTE